MIFTLEHLEAALSWLSGISLIAAEVIEVLRSEIDEWNFETLARVIIDMNGDKFRMRQVRLNLKCV